MSNVVIVTAKSVNKTYADKNLVQIGGHPCVSYGVRAGVDAGLVDTTFIYSDGEKIRSVGESYGAIPLIEAEPHQHHSDAIVDAVRQVKEKHAPDLNLVTILLGNTVAANAALVDLSIEILNKNPDLDSVMSVWQAQDDHPYRALKITEEGHLGSFLGIEAPTSRQSYPPVYYYDQGVWTFRYDCINRKEGPSPWWWMGKKSFPIIRNWVTGRDIHTQLDVDYCSFWINNNVQDEILNKEAIEQLLGK